MISKIKYIYLICASEITVKTGLQRPLCCRLVLIRTCWHSLVVHRRRKAPRLRTRNSRIQIINLNKLFNPTTCSRCVALLAIRFVLIEHLLLTNYIVINLSWLSNECQLNNSSLMLLVKWLFFILDSGAMAWTYGSRIFNEAIFFIRSVHSATFDHPHWRWIGHERYK